MKQWNMMMMMISEIKRTTAEETLQDDLLRWMMRSMTSGESKDVLLHALWQGLTPSLEGWKCKDTARKARCSGFHLQAIESPRKLAKKHMRSRMKFLIYMRIDCSINRSDEKITERPSDLLRGGGVRAAELGNELRRWGSARGGQFFVL
ncbi:hypothetical protein DM860_003738 [Cuscuta australis]|uniref:Uncharacterized protein n=1 Tax=Cuscuta australis TaxID=267555 RepID=A0A328DL23_9ASTE|nr:hypothetical protein DM860_003738 [Cuscuta australis]